MRCSICKRKVNPTVVNKYVVREPKKIGLSVAFATLEPILYDAFDCPRCGCQILAKTRLRKVEEPLDNSENSDNNELEE